MPRRSPENLPEKSTAAAEVSFSMPSGAIDDDSVDAALAAAAAAAAVEVNAAAAVVVVGAVFALPEGCRIDRYHGRERTRKCRRRPLSIED